MFQRILQTTLQPGEVRQIELPADLRPGVIRQVILEIHDLLQHGFVVLLVPSDVQFPKIETGRRGMQSVSDRRRLQSFFESTESNLGEHHVPQLDRSRVDRRPTLEQLQGALEVSLRPVDHCQVVQRPSVVRVEIEHSVICTRGARFIVENGGIVGRLGQVPLARRQSVPEFICPGQRLVNPGTLTARVVQLNAQLAPGAGKFRVDLEGFLEQGNPGVRDPAAIDRLLRLGEQFQGFERRRRDRRERGIRPE